MKESLYVLVDDDYKLLSRETYSYEEARTMEFKLSKITCNGVKIMCLKEPEVE